MSIIDMQDYNTAARRYWWTVTTLGAIVLAYSIAHIVAIDGRFMIQALASALVAALVGLFPVRVPGAKTTVAGAEIFIFLALLLYGVEAATIAAAFEAFFASYRSSKRWTSRIGGPAIAAITMYATGYAFAAVRAAYPLNNAGLLTALCGLAIVYFALGMTLLRMVFALKAGAAITPLKWLRDFAWLGLAYVTGASIAGLLYLSFQEFGLPVLLISVPLIAMFMSTLHFYFERKEDDQRHMEELKESESRFHSAFTHAAIGMALVSSEGKFMQANRAFCEMLGRTSPELLAMSLATVVKGEDQNALQTPVSKLMKGELSSAEIEIRGLHKDGSDVWMALNISLARDWQFRAHNLIVQAQDISARRRAEAELYHNAYHDSLTQLSNRTHFNECLNRAIARVQRHPEQRFAVMYLDFDRFKMVNDSLGHKAGDELLVDLARRLRATIRPTDVLARLGGDEFAVLMEDLHRQRDAVDLCERIQKELQKPFRLGSMEVAISASIGITFSTNGYQTSDQIIRDADIAMYKAKSKGKAQYAIFDSSLHQHVTAQLELESELRRALGLGQIYLEYQPIFQLAEQKLVGFEALMRWNHPERGVLDPAMFIPIAEETGLIVPLGNWVLNEACRQMAQWHRGNEHLGLRMSVNVSSLQLTHPDFVSQVGQALQAAELPPESLTLEVTESVLMEGIENAITTLNRIRDMGVTLSIDDFGTGYSSLSYLATLPIDALKVDKSFIEKMASDGNGGEIVKAIFKLGQALSKQVFAEGIETGAQLALLRELGCQFGQGYLLSRPVDAIRAGGVLAGQLGGGLAVA
ncbi:MAG TPA: EAL domain-containing protein [Usitatibacter sp.]|jgi:diguanylate cyclase (GGDEF)-like protein/PAS domain S-box-containing protein|nr:EAL domain-containing protein [Usitatibacter sp.]